MYGGSGVNRFGERGVSTCSGFVQQRRYLPQFKMLVWVGIPLGWCISLSSAYFATEHFPGKNDEAFGLALNMQWLSYLPTCIGYLSLLVCLMHTRCAKYLRQLAPYGRMALTN